MFRTRQKVKNFASLMILIIAGLFITTTAWAAVTVMTADPVKSSLQQLDDQGVAGPSDGVKSRAPEPSTLALFASGLIGMIVSFVRRTYYATKRVLDILAGILGLVCLSPLFLVTALLIKMTSKGPVFYTQIRVGKDGVPFKMYKFRTMRTDAETGTGAVWAKEQDNRVIPVGRFLRKAHIDEIPQFVNILNGDMSLIGPRPERPEFVEKLKAQIPDYEKRLRVKPGLTGLAQVWHRYDQTLEDVRQKVKYDLMYIRKLCLWTDLRIFFRTFRVVVTGEGAH